MTTDNKAIYSRFIEEVWNKGDLGAIDRYVSGSYHVRTFAPDGAGRDLRGAEGLRQFVQMMRTAFPDGKLTLDTLIAEGDRVHAQWTARGLHKGPLMGVPASGKELTVKGCGTITFQGGKIVDATQTWDMLEILMQLGLGPKMDKRKALSRRLVEEAWNRGNLAVIDDIVENKEQRAALKQQVKAYRDAFPDLSVSIIDQVAEGDTVATTWVARGTHHGMVMGVPPTARPVTVNGTNLDVVTDGKLRSSQTTIDAWELLVQLGAVAG